MGTLLKYSWNVYGVGTPYVNPFRRLSEFVKRKLFVSKS